MVTAYSVVTWEEAMRGFVLHKRATRSLPTALWYETYAKALPLWANEQGIPTPTASPSATSTNTSSPAPKRAKPPPPSTMTL